MMTHKTGKPARFCAYRLHCIPVLLAALIAVFGLSREPKAQETAANDPNPARETIERAIEALGGDRYREVRTAHSTGRYFFFERGRRAFTGYSDWIVYDPVKQRLQMGDGRRLQILVRNLELNRGWRQEGRTSVEEMDEKELRDFERAVGQDVNILLRNRVDEPGMSLFFYGPDDIEGAAHLVAVEFLDSSNDSVVVFFDSRNHRPTRTENRFTDRMGIRRVREVEFYNWHSIQGVHTPLRVDVLVDGEMSQQRFAEKVQYNLDIPQHYFLEPKPE